MPVEVGIWKIGEDVQKIAFTPMSMESKLEDIIEKDISILDPNLLIIGRQVPTAYGKFIDLLAINHEGNLVVIELKRDKTPRDVVAQVLDYGSWIQTLEDEDIAEIFDAYLQKYKKEKAGCSLDSYFCESFGIDAMPESLNEAHELLIVATELDDSTERIINYLTDFGVSVNAVFFRFFCDGGNEYLSRAWLIEPNQVEAKVSDGKAKGPWNGEFYVSFGHIDNGMGRNWEDAVKYGFISAGGGAWYSQTLNMLEPDGRIWVNIPKVGYVGVGRVLERPLPPEQFMVRDQNGCEVPVTDLQLSGTLKSSTECEPGKQEMLVRVKWEKTLPLSQAIHEKGLFGNQNSAAQPRAKKWDYTISRLKQRFGISE